MAWLSELSHDLRYAVRQLRGAPGFALTAALTLALGIGVSTALFSVVYGTWIDAFPYRDFRAILFPQAWAHDGTFADSQWGVFRQREYRTMTTVPAVAEVAAYTLDGGSVTMVGAHGPEQTRVFKVPGDSFAFLGVPPLIGRSIQPSDIRASGDAEAVVVLSYAIWQRMFNGDRSVVGRTMLMNGEPHLVIGVMPPRFGWGSASWPTNDQVWMPLGPNETNARLRAWVRLRTDVSQEVAAEQFQALFLQLAQIRPGSLPQQSFYTKFDPFEGGVGGTANSVKQMRASLRFLLFAVGFLLLIACTNVANLQLARGSARSRDVAIRLAVGASRWRIVRQLLTENIVLALAAGVLGVALAIGLTRLIVALIPQGFVPAESVIATNVPVLVFAVAIATLSGLLFGMFPAMHGSRADLNETLKDSGVGSGGQRGLRTRNLLVIAEIALSVLLITGASLAVRGYLTLEREEPPLNPDRLVRSGISFMSRPVLRPTTVEEARTMKPVPFTPEQVRFLHELPVRVRRLPTVESAVLQQSAGVRRYRIAGEVTPPDGRVGTQAVSAGYARSLGIPLVAGRDLAEAEVTRAAPVALINEAAARLWTSGRSPVGSRLGLDPMRPTDTPLEVEIVGVLRDPPSEESQQQSPAVFLPHTLAVSESTPMLYVRTRHRQPLNSANAIRAEAFTLNPDALVQRPQELELTYASTRLQPRFNLALFGALAAIALALASAGVYAVLSYHVARQRREIGIRLALGAGRGRILRMVFRLGGWLVGIGVAVGIGASLALSRYVTSQVFTVPEFNATAMVIAVAILVAVAALACLVPAYRATRVEPLRVLRSD
jgi:putative ABC transport system permease protein